MAIIGTLIAKLTMDNADFIKGSQDAAQQGNFLENNMMGITVAGAAMGGAMELAARKQAPLTESTQKLAESLNMTEGEMRDLALATTDVTFPLEDVLELFEVGRQRGIEGAEALKEYAEFWDMVGDATGESATVLAESAVALEAAGIGVDNQTEALGALGYISQETTADLDEFLRFVGRVGTEMGENTPHIDDMAAALGALEDQGLDARLAQRELQSALKETDGDMQAALEILGITEDQFESYTDAVAESSDVIERNADIHADSYTAMERLQQRAEELQYQYGDLIGVVGNFAPLMMGLGPILKGVMIAKGLLAKVSLGALVPAFVGAASATWAFTAALLANPITWIVILIIGLIAAIYLLWKNWDDVSEWLIQSWDWIKDKATAIFGAVGSFLSDLWGNIRKTAINAWNAIKDFFTGLWDSIKDIFSNALGAIVDFFLTYHPLGIIISNWDEIKQFFSGTWDSIKDIFSSALGAIVNYISGEFNRTRTLVTSIWDSIRNFILNIWDSLRSGVTSKANAVTNTVISVVNRAMEWIAKLPSRALQWGRDIIQGLINGIRNMAGNLGGALRTVVNNAVDGVKSFLGLGSPSRLFREMGIDVGEGFKRGVEAMQSVVDNSLQDLVQPQGATATPGNQTITVRHELDLRNVPDSVDGESLEARLLEALNDPQVKRRLDRVNYENNQSAVRGLGQ